MVFGKASFFFSFLGFSCSVFTAGAVPGETAGLVSTVYLVSTASGFPEFYCT
jgi:hypothetical protein